MSGTGAVFGGSRGLCRWLLVLACGLIIPGAMLRHVLSAVDQWQHLDRQLKQRAALKVGEHLSLGSSLIMMVGEELQRIEATLEAGGGLQGRLVQLQQGQQACLAKLKAGAVPAADVEFAELLRQVSELRPAESAELRILREQLQWVCEELAGLPAGSEQEAVNQLCGAVEQLQSEWSRRLTPAMSGELQLAAGSLLLRSLELRWRLLSAEEQCEDLPGRAVGLAVAERVISEQSAALQQRRQEAAERREQRQRAAETAECVRWEVQQQQQRLRQLQVELAEVRRRRESAVQQCEQREQLRQATEDVRRQVNHEAELLQLASELLAKQILEDGADRSSCVEP